MRPNIRVEIQNNVEEAMDVDESEEGEISGGDDKEMPEKHHLQFNNVIINKALKSTFTTGIDILDKKEQEKLQERAKRFQLNPSEIKNFTDEDLQLLHNSLGITVSNENNVRFEVIHMRGIEQMSAGDILDYFLEYAPISVEWIDEESCNVVWLDKVSSARALHFMSKPVRGMPVRDDSSYFDNLEESEEIDQSVLVINKNREIELQEEGELSSNKLLNEKNSVDISEITATIPPGYWRLGNKHPKSKCILLRFSLKTDKKHFKTEQFSRYYKNQGKKNLKVNVPQSGKETSHGIFGRNKDMHKMMNTENPWSVLAKNWDEDSQFRETIPSYKAEEPKIEIKNHSIRVRLGNKRKENDSDSESNEKSKKVKIPRMRMYADEEEEKIKRKKMLRKINNQIKKIDEDTTTNSDLRTVLNMTNRTHGVKIEQAEPEVFDLGATLKNRNKKMVFEIKRKMEQSTEQINENHRSDRVETKERRSRRNYSNSDDEDFNDRNYGHNKPKSKVAVVIKTHKKPAVASAVASTVFSRVSSKNNSGTESESEDNTSEASDSEEEFQEFVQRKVTSRPGFSEKFMKSDHKSPLKIEINNDHFKST